MNAQIKATLTRDTTPDDLMMACAEVPSGAIAEDDYLLIQVITYLTHPLRKGQNSGTWTDPRRSPDGVSGRTHSGARRGRP